MKPFPPVGVPSQRNSKLLTASLILALPDEPVTLSLVERIVKKSRSFREADRWDIRQNLALTAEQRIQIAHALRKRAYPAKAKDVRECHRVR